MNKSKSWGLIHNLNLIWPTNITQTDPQTLLKLIHKYYKSYSKLLKICQNWPTNFTQNYLKLLTHERYSNWPTHVTQNYLTLWIPQDVYIRHSKYVVVPMGRIYTLQWWFQAPVLKQSRHSMPPMKKKQNTFR